MAIRGLAGGTQRCLTAALLLTFLSVYAPASQADDGTGEHFRHITAAIWAGHPNTHSEPILSGTGSAWLGLFEDEAQDCLYVSGLGYGDGWTQLLVSPLLVHNATSPFIEMMFTYFVDTESGADVVDLVVTAYPSEKRTVVDTFTGQAGLHPTDHPALPPSGAPYFVSVTADILGDDTEYRVSFEFYSNGNVSDADGSYDTIYGPFGVDDVEITCLSCPVFNFEASLQGWTPINGCPCGARCSPAWVGATGSNWESASNWSGGVAPVADAAILRNDSAVDNLCIVSTPQSNCLIEIEGNPSAAQILRVDNAVLSPDRLDLYPYGELELESSSVTAEVLIPGLAQTRGYGFLSSVAVEGELLATGGLARTLSISDDLTTSVSSTVRVSENAILAVDTGSATVTSINGAVVLENDTGPGPAKIDVEGSLTIEATGTGSFGDNSEVLIGQDLDNLGSIVTTDALIVSNQITNTGAFTMGNGAAVNTTTLANTGTIVTNGTVSWVGFLDNTGTIDVNGTLTLTGNGTNPAPGVINITGVMTVSAGPFLVGGTINGLCLGCRVGGSESTAMSTEELRGGGAGLFQLLGDFESAAESALLFDSMVLRFLGDVDVAIDDGAAFDASNSRVELLAVGALNPDQAFEVMGLDKGPSIVAQDPDLFLLDELVLSPSGATISFVDARENLAGSDAVYARSLEIANGSTVDLGGQTIYYGTIEPEDPFAPEHGITILDTVGGGGLVPYIEVPSSGPDPVSPSLQVPAQVFPNPFRTSATLRYTTRSAGWVSVGVFDARGRRVRDLGSSLQGAGAHTVVWDGHDLHGRRVAPGAYWYRIQTEERVESGALTLIR